MTGEWRRVDEGDMPRVGQLITMVDYPAEGAQVKVWERLRVEVVLTQPRPGVYGASEAPHRDSIDLPGRPENHFGRATFWKETS